ncbi:hypothetical protein OUZ56_019939 [Daphnia magna]|uniref:GMP synthase n=1 Tax=Daphnia magna TaxID=35525 RepID=A0ABQ9ZDS4_9CRUS|nr:hypothetical protein OUZ56_019939 [Daphnia magna]
MTYCFRSIVFTNGDIFHNLQLPRQTPTHKTRGIRKQCEESDILALETPGAFMLQQGYKAIIISGGRKVERKDVRDGQFEIQVET